MLARCPYLIQSQNSAIAVIRAAQENLIKEVRLETDLVEGLPEFKEEERRPL